VTLTRKVEEGGAVKISLTSAAALVAAHGKLLSLYCEYDSDDDKEKSMGLIAGSVSTRDIGETSGIGFLKESVVDVIGSSGLRDFGWFSVVGFS